MDQQELRQWESRCIQEEQPFCQAACPLHVDVRAMLDALAKGEADAARKILERTLPLPGVLGLLCEAPCEVRCKRVESDGPGAGLAIGLLERFLVTHAKPGPRPLRLPGKTARAEVLGQGLAALTCAWDLLKKGYAVTLHTLGRPLGGALLELGQPGLAAALEVELATLKALGLELSAQQVSLDALLSDNRAVFLEWGFSPETDAACPPRSRVDPVTLAGETPGLFLGSWPGEGGRFSAIDAATDGRRAASSLDRHLSRVSLTASREREGASETRLFTSLEGVLPVAPVVPAGPQFDLAEARREADRCLRCQCLECVKVCTYLERFKLYPRQCARQIYNNAAIVKGQHLANKLVNSCSLCGLCGRVCPQGFDMADLCLAARREMVAAGAMPPSAHEFALEDMEAASGPECALLRPDPAAHNAVGTAEYLFFPGCQLSASHPQHVRSVYALLRTQLTGGVGLMLRCCGIPANWAGNETQFGDALSALRADWKRLGRPRVIAACAGCLSVLRDFAPDIPATSLWEALECLELPARPADRPLPDAPLALHDPCTARDNAPFRLAARALAMRLGLATEEMALSGELTECCGFGGLMSAANAPLGHEVAARRAGRSQLDYLATCAMCRDRLAAEGKRAWHLLDFVFPGSLEGSAADPTASDPAALGPGPSARREARARLKRELLGELWGEAGDTTPVGPRLEIPAPVLARLEERRILASDLRLAVAQAEASGRWFVEAQSGRRLAAFRPRRVTFWAEYAPQDAGFVLLNGWCHRMVVPGVQGLEGTGVQSEADTARHAATVQRADQTYLPEGGTWTCACSAKGLAARAVDVTYLGSVFTISLLTCPTCELPLVPETLALGRMAEVEQLLEDK